jgi:uncharacterized protein
MKNGFRVYDADTHVNPAAEVLEQYVDPSFRPRLAELAPYRVPISREADGSAGLHSYRVGTKFYRRILGEKAPRETFTGRESKWRGSKMPRPGVNDDNAANRVQDMDDEGTDVHFLIPGSWMSLVGLSDPSFEVGMARAYHRHMADFCEEFPTRLKGLIVASTRNVDEAVREICEWANSKWAVAVKPLLPTDMPPDHPDLDPIWRAAADHDLPIAHHSSTWNPPHYPGYQDVWDNIFLGRMASHPWGAMRFVASFIGGGIFDRYPTLRMGVLECGFGWLPFWARRMDEQAVYVGGVAARAEAERVHHERPLLLQHRAPRKRGHVHPRHSVPRRRFADVCLRLPPLGVPVPEFDRKHLLLADPKARDAEEIVLGQRHPFLQADLTVEATTTAGCSRSRSRSRSSSAPPGASSSA